MTGLCVAAAAAVILLAGCALVARLERFGDAITSGTWWRQAVDGYCNGAGTCIGNGQPGPHVRLDLQLPAAIEDVDLAEMLGRHADRLGPIDARPLPTPTRHGAGSPYSRFRPPAGSRGLASNQSTRAV